MNLIERPTTSESLLNLAKSGDSEAWSRITAIYGPIVYNLCAIKKLDDNDASDVTQDVFVSIYKNLDRFKKDRPTHSFMKWVLTITNNQIIDFFRARGKTEIAVGGEAADFLIQNIPNVLDYVDETQLSQFRQQAAKKILGLLNQDFKEKTFAAFYKTAVESKSAAEAAEELGMTSGAVRVAKLRVKKRAMEVYGDLLG